MEIFEYVSFFLAMAGGLYLSILMKNNKRTIFLLASLFVMIVMMIVMTSTAYNYRGTNTYNEYMSKNIEILKKNKYYLGASDEAEYFPIPVSINSIENRQDTIVKKYPSTNITNITRVNTNMSFYMTLKEHELAELPLVYYKGYYAKLNGKEIPIRKSKDGFIEIPIEQSGNVEVEFSGTPIQKYSIYITLISALLLIIYIYWYNRKTKQTT